MMKKLWDVAAVTVTSLGIAACMDSYSPESTPPGSKLHVVLSVESATISESAIMQVSARVTDKTGHLRFVPIAWKSSDPSVVSVSEGTITGVGPGTAMIIASAGSAADSATVSVTPPSDAYRHRGTKPLPVAVAGIILGDLTQDLTVGQSVQSVVTLMDAEGNTLTGRTITYSTDDASIVTVSDSGMISAVGAGVTRVHFTSGDVSTREGFTVTASPTTQAVASIAVTPASAELSVGQTSQETAVAKDEQGNVIAGTDFTWTTSNSKVATVSDNGFVSAVDSGTATIHASAFGVTGSVSVIVTSRPVAQVSVSLSARSILPGGTAQASAVATDAQGHVIADRPIIWSGGGELATISSSGVVTALLAGTVTVTATIDGVSGSRGLTIPAPALPQPPDAPPPSDEPPPSGAVTTILALLGQTKTVAATAALGGVFARYDRVFDQYLPSSDAWTDNYYDRGAVYYARYARTGDVTFLNKAHSIVLAYRQQHLEPNNYGTSPHWSQVRGLEIHYRLTGDTLSRRAVAGMYAWGLSSFSVPLWGSRLADLENPNSPHMENRIQARVLQGALSAYRMGASFNRDDGGGEMTPATWPSRLRTILNQILSVQQADGSFSWIQICGGQLNYMVGMLNDVLIEYYRDFEADPRIPGAVEKANEYLWTTQWDAADQAFSYASVNCSPVGGTELAGDLNGLMIASFGWLHHQTGDPKWKTRGDEIMAGLVSPRWASSYGSSKQFNQAFAESYRYLGWR